MDNDIYARMFDAAGTPLTAEFAVTTAVGAQQEVDVAMDAAGNFVVAWQGLDVDSEGIWARRYDSTGTALGAEFQVNATTADQQDDPSIAMASDGRFVIVWESNNQDGGGEGIYAQLYDASGAIVRSEFLANTTTSGSQSQPDVAMDDSGNFVVSWMSGDGNSFGIQFQRYDAAGIAIGGETQANTETLYGQEEVNVSMNGAGEIVFVWQSELQDGSGTGVYARRYDAAGNPQGGEIPVASYVGGSQWWPAVALHDTGFVVGWTGPGSGDDSSIFIRRYDNVDVTFVAGDGIEDGTITLQGTQAELNAVLDGLVYRPNDGYVGYDTLVVTNDDLGNTGTGGALQDVDNVTIAVGTPGIEITATSTVSAVGDEFLVNTTTIDSQEAPASASDDDGNTIVVWQSLNQDGSSYGVYAQRYDADGNAVGPEFLVNSTTVDVQDQPSVAMAGDGRFVIVWTSENQDGSGSGVYGQLYDASGAAVGGEFQVHETTAGAQEAPAVAMAADGSFTVVWQSEGIDDDGLAVVGRQFGADGVALGGEFDVNDYEIGAQAEARIAMNRAGEFVVTWTSMGQDGNGAGVYAQRFDRVANGVGSEIQVNTTTANSQSDSKIAMAADGNFVIVWRSEAQDGSDGGIYGQRYAADGTALGGEFQINTTTADDQYAPALAMNDAGDFVVTWASNLQDGSDAGVVMRSYAADGTATSAELLVNTATLNQQSLPTIAMDASGGYTIAWQSSQQDGLAGGIYAQRFTQTTSEAGAAATFDVVLTGPPTSNVVVSLALSDATEGSLSTTSLLFTTATWNIAQTVTVTGLNDALGDGDISYTVLTDALASADARYAALDPADVQLTNLDAIVTDSVVVANDDNLNTPEDTALVFDPTANDFDGDGQIVTVTEYSQPTNGTVVDNGDGTFTYTPHAGFTGVDSFDYVAIDAGTGAQHYWDLDGNATDSIGTATGVVNGTTTVAGNVGDALSFNEVDDHVEIPDVTYAAEFTISFDFKIDDNSGALFQYLYSHGDVNSTNSIKRLPRRGRARDESELPAHRHSRRERHPRQLRPRIQRGRHRRRRAVAHLHGDRGRRRHRGLPGRRLEGQRCHARHGRDRSHGSALPRHASGHARGPLLRWRPRLAPDLRQRPRRDPGRRARLWPESGDGHHHGRPRERRADLRGRRRRGRHLDRDPLRLGRRHGDPARREVRRAHRREHGGQRPGH